MYPSVANSHIRSDKDNQLRLRAEMQQSDINIIVDAGRGKLNREAARLLKARVARDFMYKVYLEYEEDRS